MTFILGIFYEQTGGPPGSCNSGSGLKQLCEVVEVGWTFGVSIFLQQRGSKRSVVVLTQQLLRVEGYITMCIVAIIVINIIRLESDTSDCFLRKI